MGSQRSIIPSSSNGLLKGRERQMRKGTKGREKAKGGEITYIGL